MLKYTYLTLVFNARREYSGENIEFIPRCKGFLVSKGICIGSTLEILLTGEVVHVFSTSVNIVSQLKRYLIVRFDESP